MTDMKLFLTLAFLMFFGQITYAQQFQIHQFKADSSMQIISFDNKLSFYSSKGFKKSDLDRYRRIESSIRQAEKAKKEALINKKDVDHGRMPNLMPEGIYTLRILYPDTSTKYSLIIIDPGIKSPE